MFEKFNDQARRAIVLAQEATRALGSDAIKSEHILLGLLKEPACVAAKALESLGVDASAVEAQIGESAEPASTEGHIPFSSNAKGVLEQSLRESVRSRSAHIGTGHILLGATNQSGSTANAILLKLGAEPAAIRDAVMQIMPPTSD